MLGRRNVGARTGYLKATLIATETKDLQEMLGLSYPGPKGNLRMERLVFGRKQQNSVKQVSFN